MNRSLQHGSGAGRMRLISISKDLFDVSKRTIVAKVKSFVYNIHTFQLDSCYYSRRTCFDPRGLVLRLAVKFPHNCK